MLYFLLDPKIPKHRVVMEYSLPTLTILLEDYNAIVEINDNRKMIDKILELDFESKRRRELLGDNLADGKRRIYFHQRGSCDSFKDDVAKVDRLNNRIGSVIFTCYML